MTATSASLEDLLRRAKQHPQIHRAGMILCHNGIVRAWDRAGHKKVTDLEVRVNSEKIQEIRRWAESRDGIVVVLIEAFQGRLQVGDDLLYVVVAGDIRERVLDTMREIIDRIKNEAVSKTEYYSE